MPSGTSESFTWSAQPAVTSPWSALRARYCRYQRQAQKSRKPSAAAATISSQTIGGSLCSSSTSSLPQQHLAQRSERCVDLNILRRPREQARQRLRYRDLAPDERLDDLAELRGVCGRHEHPASLAPPCWRQPLPGFRRGGGVWAPHLAILAIACADAGADLVIAHRAGAHRVAQVLELWVERPQAFHVARVTDIHCRGERRDARAWLPHAARQELRHGAVGIVGEQHLADRQACLARPQTGERVAEVAARDDEGGRLAVAMPDRETGCSVVRALRQETSEVDAVGGGEQTLCRELRIEKGRFHESLTVIECATHRERADVASPAGELLFLGR